jgi:hypothetical protein
MLACAWQPMENQFAMFAGDLLHGVLPGPPLSVMLVLERQLVV